MNIEYKTLRGWNKEGFRVKKGEKSHKRNEAGVAMFSTTQVREFKKKKKSIWDFIKEPGTKGALAIRCPSVTEYRSVQKLAFDNGAHWVSSEQHKEVCDNDYQGTETVLFINGQGQLAVGDIGDIETRDFNLSSTEFSRWVRRHKPEEIEKPMNFIKEKKPVPVPPVVPILNTDDLVFAVDAITEAVNNNDMFRADDIGVLEGQTPPEATKHWTSERYIQEAQSRLITHLMNQLKAQKSEQLEAIDHEQKVLSNLTLDLWNR